MPLLVRRRDVGPRTRYPEPLRDLQELQQETAQLLDQLWGGGAPAVPAPWVPDVDIEETDDAYIIDAELPGARAEDVHVEVHDGELTIRGEIVDRERQGILRRRTRRVGQFEYHVGLPGLTANVEPEARMDHGVLTVRVPKPQVSRPREIPISESQDRDPALSSGAAPAGQAAGEGAAQTAGEPAAPAPAPDQAAGQTAGGS
jgi:HSP20 family protein